MCRRDVPVERPAEMNALEMNTLEMNLGYVQIPKLDFVFTKSSLGHLNIDFVFTKSMFEHLTLSLYLH